jgi:hypothetical protein
MKKILKKFYAAHVIGGDDLRLFISALGLLAAALALAVYDTVTIVNGTVDPNIHLPFVLAIGLAAMGLIILAILRHSVSCGECHSGRFDPSKVSKDSYLHPDNWPRGRIDPPDGMSD